jgi:unsaturated rhamnogalacturonyl hydrolase
MSRQQIIDKVVKRIIEFNNPEEELLKQYDYSNDVWAMKTNMWDWVPGVGMYGLCRAWKYTENPDYLKFIQLWVKYNICEAQRVKTVNATAPLLSALTVYEATGDKEILKVCTEAGQWVLNSASRTREGGIEHTVNNGDRKFREQIWADTLFMACIFLSNLGRLTGNHEFIKEAGRQVLIHQKVLKDAGTELFYHGWNCENKNWMSGALWGRANAWMIASTVEILSNLPSDFNEGSQIIDNLHNHAAALKRVQRSNGMFGTVLNQIDSYDETSATAGIAYGIKRGIKAGYLPESYNEVWQKAEMAVIERINDKGEVLEVSSGTPVLKTLEDYNKIKKIPTLYGQGLTLLLLCEE